MIISLGRGHSWSVCICPLWPSLSTASASSVVKQKNEGMINRRSEGEDIAFHLKCWLGRGMMSRNEQSDLQHPVFFYL